MNQLTDEFIHGTLPDQPVFTRFIGSGLPGLKISIQTVISIKGYI